MYAHGTTATLLALSLACGGGGDDDETHPSPSAEACDSGSSDPSDAYDLLRPSVVFVAVDTAESVGAGTGFVYSEGEVVTNAHVVADADAISVEFAGGEVVRVTPDHVRIDGDRDVAVIEVYTGDAPSVAIGDPSSVRRGQRLIALGAARTEAHPLLRHLVRVRVDEVGGADGVGRRSFDPAGAQPEQDVRRSGSGRARVPAHAGRSSDGALARLVGGRICRIAGGGTAAGTAGRTRSAGPLAFAVYRADTRAAWRTRDRICRVVGRWRRRRTVWPRGSN